MRKLYTLALLLVFSSISQFAVAQSVVDPSDPIVNYDSNNPPATPGWNTISKWVRTPRSMGWSTDAYKCYYLNGIPFRIKFPKTYVHGVSDGKTYPALLFLHGLGEYGGVYDNEYSLFHGGKQFSAAVDAGKFDGYIIVPQSPNGYFGPNQFDAIKMVVDYLIQNNKLDENRFFVNGLSAGGTETWDFTIRFPKLVAGFLPMSGVRQEYVNSINLYKYTSLWLFQGGLDRNPSPEAANNVINAALAQGANAKLKIYPNGAHGIWTNAWAETDFYPFLNRQHKANPWALFGRTEFCPGDPINIKLGLTAGFDGYEWRKDGAVIAGATGNEITVTTIGTYDARIKRGSTWSPWSPAPVVVKLKTATVTPPIDIEGLMSKVIPAADGKTFVTLQLPEGFASYEWQKVGSTTVIGTERTLNASSAGQYIAKVTEQYGCSSAFSDPFTVIAANGTNAPEAASTLTAAAISKTAITINWSENPAPANNETGYEIYRTLTAGSNYELIYITGPDVLTYTDNGLNANTHYYYVVRAVNNTAAAALSNEATAQTLVDNVPPSAPLNLRVTGSNVSSVSLAWEEATDDVAVTKYDIYIDGVRSYSVEGDQTSFTAYNLVNRNYYAIYIKARDLAGNASAQSNQVTGLAASSGFNYKTYLGTWTSLPNFANLTPNTVGNTPVVNLSIKPRDENFAIVWEGVINIPVTGNYTFETYSDDGSKLYLDNVATAVVDNDGAHGSQYREGTKYLTAGPHPIKATFFQGGGGAQMLLYWKNTAHGVTSRQEIPASFFVDQVPPGGAAPAAPSNILATAAGYNKINVTWNDNSNNETGFEIYRATSQDGPFVTVFTTGSNVSAYTDSALDPQTTYYYRVKAINQYGSSVINQADIGGFSYYYHEYSDITVLPDFSATTPVETGTIGTPTLSIANRANNYAVKFAGNITVPTTGNYTFFTASDDGSALYIGGFAPANRVVNNDYLQGTTERSGTINLNAGTYPIYVTFFQRTGGAELIVRYQGPGIAKQVIPAAAYANTRNSATTSALPAASAAPDSLKATGASGTSINLSWQDKSTDEEVFEIYRSVNNNSNYTLLTTLPANMVAYTDSGVFAHVPYFYKIRSKNVGGTSAFTAEATSASLNSVPAMAELANRSARFGTQLVVSLAATDADGDSLTLTGLNVPAFGVLTGTGAGTATLTFSPSTADQGVYNGIQITAADQFGGSVTRSFNLTVNDNYVPALVPVSNVTLNENATATINLTATDENAGDELTWTFDGLPTFVTVNAANRTAELQLNPSFVDGGTYQVTAHINDGRDGIDTKAFTITVNEVSPEKKIFISFNDGSYVAGAPWNNTNKQPVLNDLFPNLKDESNATTSVGLKVLTNWAALSNGSNYLGTTTNNNSGVYPDNVMRTAYWTNTSTQTIAVYGLDSNHSYSFTFFGARGNVSDNRMTNYTINGTTVSLQAANNTQNTVSINNVKANASGQIVIDLKNGTGSVYGYLNALVITMKYDDGNPPAPPRNLATEVTSAGVKLDWVDAAYNELAYEVFRATQETGTYTLLKTLAADTDTFTDSTAAANATYYYSLRATNDAGASAYSDTVAAVTANRNPVLPVIDNVSIKDDSTATINIAATDDPGDIITLSATGLPSFAVLQDNGGGAGTISITPSASDIGTYDNITVTATDNNSGTSSRSFQIVVKDKSIGSVMYVNFAEAAYAAPSPWNNFNSFPSANATISNLKDDAAVSTGASITLLDAFTGVNALGMTTGDNSGIYPDNVLKTTYYTNASTARRIRISGLSGTYKYNLIFFNSRSGTDNKNTEFTANGTTVILSAANNYSNTAQINGLTPNSSGEIIFTVKNATGAQYGYINSLVIQSYIDDGKPRKPSNASATAKSKSVISLAWEDNSSNETGFEVWRATSANGTYQLLTTTAANVTTYANTGLAVDSRYYYKVRAVAAGSIYSDYSNIAAGATYRSSVYMNFNVVNPAPAPWNNSNLIPIQGAAFENLVDDNNNNTGYSIVIDKNFSGDNAFGVNTGNNSGIYPDVVISNTYWVDIGEAPARLKVRNLNLSMRYNFEFFASRDASGDRTSTYTINGKTVTLNAYKNTSETVQITNIAPNDDGEVIIEIGAGGQSAYGYIGALLIHGYAGPGASGDDPELLLIQRNSGSDMLNVVDASGGIKVDYSEEKLEIENVYPNPFRTELNLVIVRSGKPVKADVNIFNMGGQLIYSKQLGELSAGTHRQSIQPGSGLPSGIYIIQLRTADNVTKTVKVIKQ